MTRSKDRRLTTHVVRQTRIARLMFVPYNTGWHLAHHVDMGVPWRHLPQLHAELVRSGWVTEELTTRPIARCGSSSHRVRRAQSSRPRPCS